MPELNGLDVYKLLKADLFTRNIPIVFTTAMVSMSSVIKSETTEDVKVITKPFDIDKLAQQLTQICDRYDLSIIQTHQTLKSA